MDEIFEKDFGIKNPEAKSIKPPNKLLNLPELSQLNNILLAIPKGQQLLEQAIKNEKLIYIY
jgi:hypothetical protein